MKNAREYYLLCLEQCCKFCFLIFFSFLSNDAFYQNIVEYSTEFYDKQIISHDIFNKKLVGFVSVPRAVGFNVKRCWFASFNGVSLPSKPSGPDANSKNDRECWFSYATFEQI